MPIVKRNEAHYDSASPVSLAVFGQADNQNPQSSSANSGGAAGEKQDPRVEIVREANGDITKISVRCDCGQVASIHCDYAT